MKYCDLHNHSIYSDGSYTPSELVSYAKEKEICAIGLTDHNTVGGRQELECAAKSAGIECVFGSELTTDYCGKEVHLLCLFINGKNEHRVKEFTERQLKSKEMSNIGLAEKLRRGGYEISLEELCKRYGKNINRAHFAHDLVEKGYFKTTDEAFDGVLKSGNGFYNPPRREGLIEAIGLVRSWGCVPVIAHPLLSVTKAELEALLPQAKEKGLVGMEVYYPKFSDEEKDYLRALCQSYGLIESGGSDFHGNMKSQGDLNDAKAPYECYEKLHRYFLTMGNS
ncbi:MAG: PHP domain-containing protein [Clostridia bacterium]|nr:PHP domain-containing protein [Clostridia bacterium]